MSKRLSKRERVDAAIKGLPVDRVPVAAWRHLIPEEVNIDTLAQASLKFFYEYDWDWLKLNPRATYFAEAWGAQFDFQTYHGVLPHYTGPWTAFDPGALKVIDPTQGVWGDHLELIRRVKAGIGGAPFIQTLFSPASVLGFLSARPTAVTQLGIGQTHNDTLLNLVRNEPAKAHAALEVITQSLEKLASYSLEAGADGLFFAITRHARKGSFTQEEFKEFGKPYDLRVLKAAQQAKFNVLHSCGPDIYWKEIQDYPVDVLNWASVGQNNPDLIEARKTSHFALMGGIDEGKLLEKGTPAQIEAAVKEALEKGGTQKFLLSPGCCAEPEVPAENLHALRRALGK